jgi:hypothetical protein
VPRRCCQEGHCDDSTREQSPHQGAVRLSVCGYQLQKQLKSSGAGNSVPERTHVVLTTTHFLVACDKGSLLFAICLMFQLTCNQCH